MDIFKNVLSIKRGVAFSKFVTASPFEINKYLMG